MLLIIIFLLLLLVGIWLRFFLLKREIRKMGNIIRRAHDEKSNEQITVSSQDKDIVELANTINLLFGDIHDERSDHERYRLESSKNLGNISHDLRTPLTSVIGYIQLLRSGDASGQKEQWYLDVASKRAAMLKQLVDGLYELTCLDTHIYPFEIEVVEINAQLANEVASYYDKFMEISEEPVIELEDSPLPILADKSALTRIFDNLLQNMIQHRGTDIHISSKRVHNSVQVCFSNKVTGLPAETATRLFERFFSGDKSRSGQGSGLGLSIVKEFVEQMGGHITSNYQSGVLSFVMEWPVTTMRFKD